MEKVERVFHLMPASSRNTTRFVAFMDGLELDKSHLFWVYGDKTERVPFDIHDPSLHFKKGSFFDYLSYVTRFKAANKLVIHGLFDIRLMVFLVLFPSVARRCYWVIWGGDLYSSLRQAKNLRASALNLLRTMAYRRLNHVCTYIPGDVDLLEAKTGRQVNYHECLMYPGNLYKDYPDERTTCFGPGSVVLVGNSGTPENNHDEVFRRLSQNKFGDIRVVCPLSYGDPEYIERICSLGNELFGGRFHALKHYMDLQDYVSLLHSVDYGVFYYDRQQGMGNIISLLGLGKGVFINPKTTPWDLFMSMKVELFDVAEIEGFNFSVKPQNSNRQIIEENFSREKLAKQIKDVFDA